MTDAKEDFDLFLERLMEGDPDTSICLYRDDENPFFVELEIWELGDGEYATRERTAEICPRIDRSRSMYTIGPVYTHANADDLNEAIHQRIGELAAGVLE